MAGRLLQYLALSIGAWLAVQSYGDSGKGRLDLSNVKMVVSGIDSPSPESHSVDENVNSSVESYSEHYTQDHYVSSPENEQVTERVPAAQPVEGPKGFFAALKLRLSPSPTNNLSRATTPRFDYVTPRGGASSTPSPRFPQTNPSTPGRPYTSVPRSSSDEISNGSKLKTSQSDAQQSLKWLQQKASAIHDAPLQTANATPESPFTQPMIAQQVNEQDTNIAAVNPVTKKEYSKTPDVGRRKKLQTDKALLSYASPILSRRARSPQLGASSSPTPKPVMAPSKSGSRQLSRRNSDAEFFDNFRQYSGEEYFDTSPSVYSTYSQEVMRPQLQPEPRKRRCPYIFCCCITEPENE